MSTLSKLDLKTPEDIDDVHPSLLAPQLSSQGVRALPVANNVLTPAYDCSLPTCRTSAKQYLEELLTRLRPIFRTHLACRASGASSQAVPITSCSRRSYFLMVPATGRWSFDLERSVALHVPAHPSSSTDPTVRLSFKAGRLTAIFPHDVSSRSCVELNSAMRLVRPI